MGDLSGRVFDKRRGYPRLKAAVADHRLPFAFRSRLRAAPLFLRQLDPVQLSQGLGANRSVGHPFP